MANLAMASNHANVNPRVKALPNSLPRLVIPQDTITTVATASNHANGPSLPIPNVISSLTNSLVNPRVKTLLNSLPRLSMPQNPKRRFAEFSSFPKELRDYIWKIACHNDPRIITLRSESDDSFDRSNICPDGQRKQPALLAVSKEARQEALKHYQRCDRARATGLLFDIVYTNFHVDDFWHDPECSWVQDISLKNLTAQQCFGYYKFPSSVLEQVEKITIDFNSIDGAFGSVIPFMNFLHIWPNLKTIVLVRQHVHGRNCPDPVEDSYDNQAIRLEKEDYLRPWYMDHRPAGSLVNVEFAWEEIKGLADIDLVPARAPTDEEVALERFGRVWLI